MKKIIGIILLIVLMMVGCKEQTKEQLNLINNPSDNQTKKPTSSPANIVKTYNDETHMEIKYGKMLLNLDWYHVVSDTYNGDSETFYCEINKGEAAPESCMTIKIRDIEQQSFTNTEGIVSYLNNISPGYEKIRIYNHVTDDSGIISLYSVSGGDQTSYVICYEDSCYLIESDYSILEIYLFKDNPESNYMEDKFKIKCAKSYITNVNETVFGNDDHFEKVVYEITQGKDGTKYSALLSRNDIEYNFTLKNDKGEELQTLSTDAPYYYDVINFFDVNMDGYADIQLLDFAGAMNSSYALYVWDASLKNFVKVKCDEMLSNIEVYDGYLMNSAKSGAGSGVNQKFIWKNNYTLEKVYEESYQIK